VLNVDSLWRPGEHGGEVGSESAAFIELLRARLGPEAVHGVQILAEHRPEAAWRIAELEAHEAATRTRNAVNEQPPWPAFRRPLWLLPEPQPLSERNRMPCYRGPLQLSEEPERIETGWWDGKDISRDYYSALDVRGVKLWIFRECAEPHAWFLHGFFG
jgi:protein ImuB